MADPIYGIHQSQPRDIYDFMKANGRKLGLEGRFSYLPILRQAVNDGLASALNNGIEMIVSDEIAYYEEPLMDGRTRRYAKTRILLSAFGSYLRMPQVVSIEEEMKQLGYVEMETVLEMSNVEDFRNYLGLQTYSDETVFNYAEILEIKAGVPSYQNADHNVEDAPHDGREYVRKDGVWDLADHSFHPDIDGGTATL